MKRQSKSRSKSKQRYRKGATISSKSSQSRSREPVDRRFLKGPFCDSIQLNTITSSAVVDD